MNTSSAAAVTETPAQEQQEGQASRIRGTVRWFSDEKGYGFLAPANGENNGKDVFVHAKAFRNALDPQAMLYEGDVVEFEIGKGRDGRPAAQGVVILERAGPKRAA